MWLVYHKQSTGRRSIRWSEAVDEALCFGWIDSTVRPLEGGRHEQWFGPRTPRSPWSKVNKDKVERLSAEGRMTPAGLAAIERAKANGSWSAMDSAEALEEPPELSTALAAAPGARLTFDTWSSSYRKAMYGRIAMARRPETKARRAAEIAAAAAEGRKPL